jgi:thiamine biosynthesis lipoprotein
MEPHRHSDRPAERQPGMPFGFQLEFARWAMACRFEVLLKPGQPPHGPSAAIKALDEVDRLESLLSVYRETSEFSRLNQLADRQSMAVSQSVFELLQLGLQIHRDTQGAFDLTAASLSEAWGFSRRQGRMPSLDEIERSLASSGSEAIQLNEKDRTVRFAKPGLKVNSGGIGKGFALDRAAAILRQQSVEHFLVHGGHSSILARGGMAEHPGDHGHGSGWPVRVVHPAQPHVELGVIRLHDQALGTSGAANQFFYFKGVRYGHIIDPRTGWPVGTVPGGGRPPNALTWLSTTVLAASAAVADALATALFVMGPTQAEAFCASHRDIGFLGILAGQREGQVLVVQHNADRVDWTASRPCPRLPIPG